MSRITILVALFFSLVALPGCSGNEQGEAPKADVGKSSAAPVAATANKPAPTDACRLSMGWDPWEPYHYRDVSGTVGGLDIEIVSAIAERAGCEISFNQDHWSSLLKMLRSGEVDLLAGATRTGSREAFAHFSDPYREESFALYVRAGEAGSYVGATLEDLLGKGFRVGVTNEYVYGPEVSGLESDPRYSDKFQGVSIGEVNFEKLRNMEIDGFLEDPFVAAAMMRKRDLSDEVERHAILLDSGPVHLMFSRSSVDAAIVARINEGLRAIRADGTYQSLLDKYRN